MLLKLASPGTIPVGGEVTYSLMVSNGGDEVASNVTLIDTLPSLVTLVSAESEFGSCTQVGDNVVCELGSLVQGDTAEVTAGRRRCRG